MRLMTLAPLVLSAIASAQDLRVPVPVPPFRAGLPERGLENELLLSHVECERGVIRGHAALNFDTRKVRLSWRWLPDWPKATRGRSASSFIEFDGIVTDFAWLEDGVLVVAGKDSSGHTLLERVEHSAPVVDVDACTLIPGRPVARRTLWKGERPLRHVIAHLARWPGDGPPRLVAVMWDTPEILAFDLETSAWSRLAAERSFGEPGVLDVPELTRTFYRLSVRNHRRHGHMLTLSTIYGCFPGKQDITLVLADVDRDGVLDYGLCPDEEEWGREFGHPDFYVR